MEQKPVIILTEDGLEDLLTRSASLAVERFREDLERSRSRELMTKAELADYLRCDVSKINRLMKDGLPWEPFGSTPRFRKADIDHWLRNGSIQEIQGQAA